MPRLSARGKALRDLRRIVANRRLAATNRDLMSDQDSSEDEFDQYWESEYEIMEASRFIDRSSNYRRRGDRWKVLFYGNEELNDTEFQEHIRLPREAFFRLVVLLKDDPIFQSSGSKPFRGGVELHLLALLKYLGTYGNDNSGSKLSAFLGIASGSIHNYLYRASTAVMRLEASTLTWPDPTERKLIAQRISDKYGFVNCVGVTDGTLLPLALKPRHNDEDYYSRQASYSVNALITCDDVARVRSIVVGWPGSVHDTRVWINSPLVLQAHNRFKHNEVVLGDSAFQASVNMIPAFKNPPKAQIHPNKKYFNTKLAKVCIKSEHCFGLMKMRFQHLREIRVKLTKKRKHMRRLIRYGTCACILHNLLIAEPIPRKWQRELDRLMTSQLDDDDELNAPVAQDANGDVRRNQLLAYLLEVRT